MATFVATVAKKIVTAFIRAYQLFISPLLGPRCRFYPSCSNYAIEAINQHGVIKGCWLASKRLLKCHPLNPGGYDPVPSDITQSRDKK